MFKIFAIVETATGRLRETGTCASDEELAAVVYDPGTEQLLETEELFSTFGHWFDGESFQIRQHLTAAWDKQVIDADGVDTATLSGLPIPCQVSVDGVVYDVDDGGFEFAATSPGDFHVMVDEVQYITERWMIDAS